MAADDIKVKTVVLSNRKVLTNAVRQAMTDLKFGGSKTFCESPEECLKHLDDVENDVIWIIDWDMGVAETMKVFDATAKRPEKERWSIFLIATEQSEKIIAAGAENNVARIHIGQITAQKLKASFEDLLKDLKHSLPLKSLMKKISEDRKAGEWESATTLLKELYKKDATNRRVAYELGENYLQQKQWQECYEVVEPLLSSEPPDARILHVAGKALIKLGKPEQAAQLLGKADILNPFNAHRLVELGQVLLGLNKVSDASDAFGRAQAIDENNTAAVKGLGTCTLLEGDVNDALRLLKDSVTGKELASVFNTAAVLAMRQGAFPKGISLYEAAEKVLSDKPDVLARIFFNKGLGFYRWQKIDDAKKCFEDAIRLDPSFSNAKHNLKAVTQELSGARTTKISDITAVAGELSFDDSMKDVFNDSLSDEDERI